MPGGHALHQADGTAWMAFYCSTILAIALEIASQDPDYEDVASKFFEHFMTISDAMNYFGETGLWHEEEGFYYDQIRYPNDDTRHIRVRSLVGLIPLIAAENLEGKRLERLLRYLFSEDEFLSGFGIRSLSKYYEEQPYRLNLAGEDFEVKYTPGDSDSWRFGGNSNWRGPVWFPISFLIIEALRGYHQFYGDDFTLEFPTGSGTSLNLEQCADELSDRMTRLFLPDGEGRRPCHGESERYADDPHFKAYPLFYEFFHGDTGKGLGASHQTGWTALVAELFRPA